MTSVYDRPLPNGPAAHALVIGVGSYPNPLRGGLRAPDLPSSTRGATLFADWLIKQADALRPPLASVEVLLSPPGGAQGTYGWAGRIPQPANAQGQDPRNGPADVEAAAGDNVESAGDRWRQRLQTRNDNTAILYVCGHGVATQTRSLVLLSDINKKPKSPWTPHLDIHVNVARMRRTDWLGHAYVFVDACQEVITEFLLAAADEAQILGQSVYLFDPPVVPDAKAKVYVLVPGPTGALAYDDGVGGGGRFTQILIEALSGAAAWNFNGAGRWAVTADTLHSKMKLLHSLRTNWQEYDFDPIPIFQEAGRRLLLEFDKPPRVPVRLKLEPTQAMQVAVGLAIRDAASRPIAAEALPPVPPLRPDLWIAWPEAALGTHFVAADFPPDPPWANIGKRTQIDISEMRVDPHYHLVHDVS